MHQFQSPEWYHVLKHHLAALALHSQSGRDADEIFKTIVKLKQGEALVFCPKAYLNVEDHVASPKFVQLEDGYAMIRVRRKVTADGGRSIVASDAKQ